MKKTTKEITINSRLIEAAKKYVIVVKGYDVLEEGWITDKDFIGLVCKDNDANSLVFIDCLAVDEFKEDHPSRKRFERLFVEWAKSHHTEPCGVRFDVIQIIVSGENTGLVRHHINALQGA